MARHPSRKDIAAVQKWEQEALSDYFSSMSAVDSDAELKALWEAVRALVFARSPREVMEVIAANPGLLTERGDATLNVTEHFIVHLPMPFAAATLRDRREWLTRMREVGTGASGPALPDA
ncbi:hypothetical protein [Pseudonocardia sp. T1-2H]|uniref:hypothetical protein n=1 Tax=Pseudonocardia sp. T1-2H TaxID=3128899 RepID=UPI0031019E4A